MAINRENYPEYFLDFFEGRLSEADKADLFVFLDAHPELKEEFEAFDMVGLVPDAVTFPERESLKRGMVTPANYEWYFAAYVEGDLSDDERAAVEYFASGSNEMARELRLMQLSILGADHAVAFPGKSSLKHHVLATANSPVDASASGTSASGTSASNDTVTDDLESGAAISIVSASKASASGTSESSGGSSVHGRRRLLLARPWYYISAAAVVLWLAGLFFLRTPDPAINNLFSDFPAAKEVDTPKAVADIPSAARGPEQTAANPTEAATSTENGATSPGQSTAAVTASVTTPDHSTAAVASAITTPAQHPAAIADARNIAEPSSQQAKTEGSDRYSPIPQQSHLIAAAITSLQPVNTRQAVSRTMPVSQHASYEAIAYKTEYAYWSQSMLPSAYYTEEEYGLVAQHGTEETGLTQLALSSLQKALPVDFSKVDDHLKQGRIPLKELAGIGLAELGVLATNTFGIERETDDQGRTLAIRAGDFFEARRSKR